MVGFKDILLLSACLIVGACGIKPGDVSAPEGMEESAFPRTYPNVKTDPKPQHEE